MTIATTDDLQRYKSFKGITTDAQDDEIKRLLGSAWSTAERRTGLYLNRTIGGEAGERRHFIGDGGKSLVPDRLPLVSIETLTIDGEGIPLSESFYSPGYYIDGDFIRLRGYTFPPGAEVDVYMVYGLAEALVPEDLRQAVYKLAAIEKESPGHLGQKSTSGTSRETTTYFDDIPPDIAAVFASYSRVYL